MLSQRLKSEVEKYYYRVKDTNPLFANASNGTLSEREIAEYLYNIQYLITFTPVYLGLATRRCEELGLTHLAGFYRSKKGEEVDHDRWAEDDLSRLKAKFQYEPTKRIAHPIKQLVTYLEKMITENPKLYLGYILLAEYFTVLLGPQWLSDLEANCNIPASMMTVIGNHASLDKEHVLDDIHQLDTFLANETNADPFVAVVKTAADLHEQFCSLVGTVHGK